MSYFSFYSDFFSYYGSLFEIGAYYWVYSFFYTDGGKRAGNLLMVSGFFDSF